MAAYPQVDARLHQFLLEYLATIDQDVEGIRYREYLELIGQQLMINTPTPQTINTDIDLDKDGAEINSLNDTFPEF